MKRTYFLLLMVFLLSCADKQEGASSAANFDYRLVTTNSIYKADDLITLKFEGKGGADLKLMLTNAFGSSVIFSTGSEEELQFTIPKNFSRKAGPCHWVLLANGYEVTQGSFEIAPKTNLKPSVETYFGPRSITAGDRDYSMLVHITTDPFDNVYPEGTVVQFKSQFLNSINEYMIPSKDLISWKNINATRKSGRILVNTTYQGIDSKELTTIVFPTLAETFGIEADRNHNFADGNQIMKLRSTIIRDVYNNIVSDGTMVNYIIKNSKGAILKTMAPTINGMSTANILHPSEKEDWRIKAYVTGAAESNELSIGFETAIEDYEVNFSADNRRITVGPLRSFMKQLVPDGILVQLEIYDQSGQYLETVKVSSIKGFGIIDLPKEYYPDKGYHLVCKAVGITKEFDLVFDEK